MMNKKSTRITILAALIAISLLSGVAFSVVKAQTVDPEPSLPEPSVSSETAQENQPQDLQCGFEPERHMRAERQGNMPDCICEGLTDEECDAARMEHRLEQLDERLAQGLISQEQYDEIRAKIEAGEEPPYGPQDGTGHKFGQSSGQGMRHGMPQGEPGMGQRMRQGGQRNQRGAGNDCNCPCVP